ncbi:hypothetical protein ABK040_009945 [Willaertia magna]
MLKIFFNLIYNHHYYKSFYKVYDLTKFTPTHPGGDVVARTARSNANVGFYDIQHPKRAFVEMEDCRKQQEAEKNAENIDTLVEWNNRFNDEMKRGFFIELS